LPGIGPLPVPTVRHTTCLRRGPAVITVQFHARTEPWPDRCGERQHRRAANGIQAAAILITDPNHFVLLRTPVRRRVAV
jgi:hypothetical protein